ncbi:MAG: hypothetical protein ACLGPL_04345, partial [Acidobacteriota bacterium]
MTKRIGIAGKFIVAISIGTMLLLAAIGFMMVRSSDKALTRQSDEVSRSLRTLGAEQEKVLREQLMAKGDSMAALMEQIGVGLIVGYDFAMLQQVADSAMKDPDIASVTFFNTTGAPVTKQPSPVSGVHGVKRDIAFGGKKVGGVEVSVRLDKVSETIGKFNGQAEGMIGKSKTVRDEARGDIIRDIVLVAALGLLGLWIVTFCAFRRLVVDPVR